ncbi:PilN domain-containing protein [Ideonella sp. DXS22W]|uniref:PilN domain-containing protein n=1 Tax=Pseudaquabacterium inlustre TaxID=2984192 RepID=A0ABU9CR82_9BURK
MILINLLPHREERRRQRKRNFFVGLGVSALVGALAAGAWTVAVQQLTQQQEERNTFLRGEIGKLEAQIKDIATLKGDIEGLKARQAAVEDLQLNRNVPVHLLDELVRQTPEGVYLSSLRQTDAVVQVSGVAQTNERVSEFLRNTQNNSQWLSRVELVEIKAVTLPPVAGSRDARRLFEFSMRMTVKLPGTPAAGASAPAPAAAASARAA